MLQNPFRPTFGVPPLFWVGRAPILDSFQASLLAGPGAFGRAMIISGTRGIGKTVLLNELEDRAEEMGWVRLRASGRSEVVRELVETSIPQLRATLDPPARRRVSRVGISSLGSIGFDHDTEPPFVPTLNTQLRGLLDLLGDTGVLITVDEVQDASPKDLTQLAVTFQDLLRDELNVAIVLAGLPQGIATLLDLPGATFLRRAQRHVLGPFSPANSLRAFTETTAEAGLQFTEAAADAAVELSRGYPFLVQLVGSLAFARAAGREAQHVDEEDVTAIADAAIAAMGTQVHAPALRDLTDAQRSFLQAMAALAQEAGDSETPVAIGDIAERLGRNVRSLSAVRRSLLDADLIEPATHGTLRFVVPYLPAYLLHVDSVGRVD